MKKKLFFIFSLAILVDRITKWWALTSLTHEPMSVCYGLNFSLVWNRGVTWGLGAWNSAVGYFLLTSFITLLIACFVFFIRQRMMQNLPVYWEVLVLAAALSNLFDRFIYGAVIDFIELYCGSYYWPVFNIADVLIIVGMCGIFLRFYGWRTHDNIC